MSNDLKKLAGQPSSEDGFGRCPRSKEPDGAMRLERKKIRRLIKEGAPAFRKALSTGAKGRRRKQRITEAKRASVLRWGRVRGHEEGAREGYWA